MARGTKGDADDGTMSSVTRRVRRALRRVMRPGRSPGLSQKRCRNGPPTYRSLTATEPAPPVVRVWLGLKLGAGLGEACGQAYWVPDPLAERTTPFRASRVEVSQRYVSRRLALVREGSTVGPVLRLPRSLSPSSVTVGRAGAIRIARRLLR